MTTTSNQTSPIRQDLFDAIKFDSGLYPKKNCSTGKLLGAHFVFAWIFQETWSKVTVGLATANKYKLHSTKALFNDAEVWEAYERPIQIAIGRCLAYFVANKMLPLACVNPHGNNRLYVVLDH